ncbi:SAM-dependent methyltransferase [Desulfonema limicola]|uniref:SAM-dependent methyltransferase n=1 Tax=Desulfonema limicola TaxID=45656 RepID=A0A975GJP9_9BACT|nr:methyltransferase [Desulfonema limicola]QTA83188.1 SAM-dependent methyltransferase [Desulfonema limicola]
MHDLTYDKFFNGRLQVMQQQKGYRFSLDAVLLAHYAGFYEKKTILDLGTGCGIIPLIIGFQCPYTRISGVEIQKQLADTAVLNVNANNMEKQINILCKDMKTLTHQDISGPVDMVVTNPPYRKLDSGRINPGSQKAIARHEIKVSLADVIQTAVKMLNISGIFLIIYPVERLAELLSIMHNLNLEPKFLRMIHSRQNCEAKLVIAEGIKGGRPGIKIGSPLVIYELDGRYTDEVNRIFMQN